MKKYISIFALILLLVNCSMESIAKTDRSQLANCLTAKGWVMYEAAGCGSCKKQKNSFGAAFASIKTIECGSSASQAEMNKCSAQNIRYTPTWLLTKNGVVIHRLVGNQSLDKLAKVSGCG